MVEVILFTGSLEHDPVADIRPEARPLSTHCAAGRRVGGLTNEMDLFNGAAFREQLPILTQMNAIVDATYTGTLKSDARAYQAAPTRWKRRSAGA